MKSYTPDQITEYLSHISHPTPTTHPPPTLSTLRHLTTLHLAAVPFESLSLHYTPERNLTVDPEGLFRKIIKGNGVEGGRRGGYCMEVNTLFACVLRGLGFDVLSVGARISFATQRKEGEGYLGWSHMANIVTVDERRYLVDIGFGGNTPLYPLPFPHPLPPTPSLPLPATQTSASPYPSRTTDNRKLTLKPPLTTSHPSTPPTWVYSHRSGPDDPWIDAYALSAEEFLLDDYRVMNLGTQTGSIFTKMVVCVRGILSSETWFADRQTNGDAVEVEKRGGKGAELVGQLVLHDKTVKYRLLRTPIPSSEALASSEECVGGLPELGEEVHLESFGTEEERVAALEKYFGIVLSEEEKAGIIGRDTAIVSS